MVRFGGRDTIAWKMLFLIGTYSVILFQNVYKGTLLGALIFSPVDETIKDFNDIIAAVC